MPGPSRPRPPLSLSDLVPPLPQHPSTFGPLPQPEVQRRTFADFVKPVDESLIASIQGAIGQGLDGQTALALLSGVVGGIDERFDAYRTRRASRQDQMMALPGALEQIAGLASSGVPSGAVEAAYSGFRGPAAQGLDDVIGGIYGGQDVSPMYAAASGLTLTPEDIATLVSDAQMAAVSGIDPATGQPSPSMGLHDLRMQHMTTLRLQGYPEAELARAYDVLGKAYVAAGGDPGGTPVTSTDRSLAVDAVGAAPAGLAPAPSVGQRGAPLGPYGLTR